MSRTPRHLSGRIAGCCLLDASAASELCNLGAPGTPFCILRAMHCQLAAAFLELILSSFFFAHANHAGRERGNRWSFHQSVRHQQTADRGTSHREVYHGPVPVVLCYTDVRLCASGVPHFSYRHHSPSDLLFSHKCVVFPTPILNLPFNVLWSSFPGALCHSAVMCQQRTGKDF